MDGGILKLVGLTVEGKMQSRGMDEGRLKKKRASIPLTFSDVMLMQLCPAGCERRRGEECRKKNETLQY